MSPEDKKTFEKLKKDAHLAGYYERPFDFKSLVGKYSKPEIFELQQAYEKGRIEGEIINAAFGKRRLNDEEIKEIEERIAQWKLNFDYEHLWDVHRQEKGAYDAGQLGRKFLLPENEKRFTRKERQRFKAQYKLGQDHPLPDEEVFDSKTYKLGNKVGSGSFGTVYEGFNTRLERKVAIKIQKSLQGKMSVREAKLPAGISSPYVVHIEHVDKMRDGRLYIAMAWIDGKALMKIIQPSPSLPDEGDARNWMLQCCRGMKALASLNLLHRDLTPNNILIESEKKEVRIIDFGLAKQTTSPQAVSEDTISNTATAENTSRRTASSNTRGGSTFSGHGTPYYMAWEQSDGRPDFPQSDIYSFGCTFYHLLTGRPPFLQQADQSIRDQHKEVVPPDPRDLNERLSSPMKSILMKCLEKKPENRYESFEEIENKLIIMGGLRESTGIESPWDNPDPAEAEEFHLDRYNNLSERYLACIPLDAADLRYDLESDCSIVFEYGNIVDSNAQILVSPTDSLFTMEGGVSQAIRKAAANEDTIKNSLAIYKNLPPGQVISTPAGEEIQADLIFHAVTIENNKDGPGPNSETIEEILDNSFSQTMPPSAKSIAIPLLGTGNGRLERKVCMDTMMRHLVRKLLTEDTTIKEARIVIWPRES